MKLLREILPNNLLEAIGWGIIHSLWQGLIIALLLGVILLLLRRSSASIRYWLSSFSIVLMLVLFFGTVIYLKHDLQKETPGQQLSRNVINNTTSESVLLPTGFSPDKQTFLGELSDYFKSNMPLIVGLWFIGIIFFGLRFMGGIIYIQRLKYYYQQAVPEYWLNKLNNIKKSLGIRKNIRFCESGLASAPMIIGYFSPVILFPMGILSNIPVNQVEAILAHELAHIKRKDSLINILQSIIEVLMFYHPAVWWISSIMRTEREVLCDDAALNISEDSITYIKALASLEEIKHNSPAFALSILGNKKKLLTRINRIMGRKKQKFSIKEALITAVMLVLSITFISAGVLQKDKDSGNMLQDTEKMRFPDTTQQMNSSSSESEDNIDSQELESQKESIDFAEENMMNISEESMKSLESQVEEAELALNELESAGKVSQSSMVLPDTNDKKYKDLKKIYIHNLKEKHKMAAIQYKKQLALTKEIQKHIQNQINDTILNNYQEAYDNLQKELKRLQIEQFQKQEEILKKIQESLKDINKDSSFNFHFDYQIPDSLNVLLNKFYSPHQYYEKAKDCFADAWVDWDHDTDTDWDIYEDVAKKWKERQIRAESSQRDRARDRYRDVHANTWTLDKRFYPISERISSLMVVKKQMIRDCLIDRGESMNLKFTKKNLYINGEKQTRKVYKKYKILIETLTEKEIKDEFTVSL